MNDDAAITETINRVAGSAVRFLEAMTSSWEQLKTTPPVERQVFMKCIRNWLQPPSSFERIRTMSPVERHVFGDCIEQCAERLLKTLGDV